MTAQTQTTTNKKPLFKRIKPVGWVFIAFLAIATVGLALLAIRPLTYPIRSLPTGAEALSTAPTITPYVKPTNTVAPTHTPLPGGWTQSKALNGKLFMTPPKDVQQMLDDAYQAVFACAFVADATDADLLRRPIKRDLCDEAQKWMTFPVDRGNSVEIDTFGPLNPVKCATDRSCTLAQAKLEPKGVILFDDLICRKIKRATPCIVREGISGLTSYQLQIATLEIQEDGSWKVTKWDTEELPGPPPSP